MKSKLQMISTVGMSREEWLRFRLNGVGASDASTVLGLNPYKSKTQLFYEKVGMQFLDLENLAMFMGKEQEEFIANLWQYWEHGKGHAGMMANYRAEKIIRRCQRVNAYVVNPDYPWLFVSLDRKINKSGGTGEGALECKRMGSGEAKKWEFGIVPGHIIQVQTQIMVSEFYFGEMAVLEDGPDYNVFPFDYSPDICKNIVKVTKDFWERVTEARKVSTRMFDAQRNFNMKAAEKYEAELQQLEPEPDGTQAYADYLKERYKIDDPGEKAGTDLQLAAGRKMLTLSEEIKKLEAEKMLHENKIKRAMADKITKLTFGDNGYISWRPDVNKVRRFSNKVKPEIQK